MNFTAPAFVLGLPLVVLLHRLLPPRARWVLLLAASLGFYALGSPKALPLLACITLGTYAAALAIGHSKSRVGRKLWLCCAAILCLGCLGVFKYAGLFGTGTSLLLPAGISFYTFQTLGYVIDVYRGRLAPERHLGYYALFVSFFPQLVAGPIERSTDLLPQLRDPARRTDSGGWLYILRGFCKKLLLADTAAVFIDTVYAAPGAASGPAAILATVLFAGQIYWDFSGYSDIAVGAAALLGVRLSRNFDHPYRADSLRDFWRRWHISLSSWFRDYVYIPLGGSKKGEGRTYLNLLVVWLFTGLWHGSTLNFLLWGLFLFALISLERLGWGKVLRRSQVISRLYMLLVIPLSWMLFAIPSLKDIGSYIGRLFAFSGGTAVHARDFLVYGRQYAVVLVIGLLVSTPLPEKLWRRIRTSPLGTVLLLVLFWVCVYCMAVATNDPFMYFSF